MSGTLRFTSARGEPFEAVLGPVIAEGGGGRVLEASLARPVHGVPDQLVVKQATSTAPRLVELERESCERVDHPGLVKYLGASRTHDHGTLLAFERLAPNPLLLLNAEKNRPRFRDPGTTYYPLPPGRAIELAYDLLLALEHLHSRSYVHADVKLANLLARVPVAAGDGRAVLASVGEGSFEGVLIDMGSLRSVSRLDAISRGDDDPELIPRLTPVYAPPEALFERAELGGRRLYSPAMDAYAAALVFYVLLTGRVPYGHALSAAQLASREAILEAKLHEARGDLSPVDLRALPAIPLHDVAFEGDPRLEWPAFHDAVAWLLRRCLDPDPVARLSVAGARAFCEEELRLRPSGTSGGRSWLQGLFQMHPRANRLGGDRPSRAISVREENGQTVVSVAGRRVSDATVMTGSRFDVGEGTTLHFKREQTLGKTGHVPPPPRDAAYLAAVLREHSAGRPLPVCYPVLVTRTGYEATQLALCLVYSLGSVASQVLIQGDGTFVERRRVVVGRGEGADVSLPDRLVSKQHCAFERRRDGWWVEDLGSVNGTSVGGTHLAARRPVHLRGPLATVTLGADSKLTFMDEPSFVAFVEEALVAWRQAFGRGHTGKLPKQVLESVARQPSPPHPTATTRRLPRITDADLLDEAPAPPPLPAGLEEKLRGLFAEKASVEIVLEGARVETPDDLDEALAILKDEPRSVLAVEARLASGAHVRAFERAEAGKSPPAAASPPPGTPPRAPQARPVR